MADSPSLRRYRVYGVTIETSMPLPRLPSATSPADLRFDCVAGQPLPNAVGGEVVYDDGSVRVARDRGRWTVQFSSAARHVIDRDRITCYLPNPSHRYLVPIQLLGMVLAVWLESSGRTVLHASCVELDGRAALFLAGPKAGKTSLAAGFARRGAAVVTEDLAAVASSPRHRVAPGYPWLRMWPESVHSLVGDPGRYERYHPAFEKVWVPLEDLGAFSEEGANLHRIYLPVRGGVDETHIQDVSHAEGMRALLGGSFLAAVGEPVEDVSGRLDRLAALVASVPIRSLRYPDGYRHLDAAVDAVARDL